MSVALDFLCLLEIRDGCGLPAFSSSPKLGITVPPWTQRVPQNARHLIRCDMLRRQIC